MALSSFVGSFNTGTAVATTTIPITGVGFTPEVVIFWWSGRSESTDTIGRASHYRGFGAAVSATDRRAVSTSSIDALTAADTQSGHDEAACILSIDATPAIDGAIDLQSFDVDGFTLIVDDQMPRDLRVHFMALAGDITNAATGRFTESNTVGDQDVTDLAFQPDFVLFFSAAAGANPPGAVVDSALMIGAAVSSTQQGVYFGVSNSGAATMNTQSYSTSGECIALPNAAVTLINSRADFVSFLSNGFRVNWVESAGSRRIHYLALKGGNYWVDNLLTQTDTVTDIAESGFGFSPSAAMFVSHGQVESTSDTLQANDRMSIGAFSGLTTRGAQATLDENGTADSEVTTAIELDAIYVNIAADSTIAGLMDAKSRDADGFTAIMDDADPAQAFVLYAAFGPAAAGAVTLTVSVSETITLTESATATTGAPQVSASETVTLSETVAVAISTAQVSVSETITLTEAAAVVVSDPQVSASETITLTETTTLNLVSLVSTSETVTLSETVSQELVFTISASETITLTEAVTIAPLLLAGVSVGETVTLTELAAVAVIAAFVQATMPDNAAYVRFRDKRAMVKGR